MERTNNNIIIATTQSITLNLFYDEIIKRLLSENYNITLAINDPNNLKYNLNYIKLDLPKKIYQFLNIFKIIKLIYKIRKILKNNKSSTFLLNTPLVAHLFRFSSFFLKTKIIYFVHGYRFHDTSNKLYFLFFFFLEYILSFKTNAYININSYDYNITKKFFNKNNLFINGVGIKLETKYKKRNKNNTFVVGVISAYRRNKGYDKIISVANHLGSLKKKIKFECFGYGDKIIFNNEIIKKNIKNIQLNDFTSNIEDKIRKFDILLHLSVREGLPVSLMQSLTLGVPIIATDIRGNRDLVTHNYNGHLVNLNTSIENISYLIIKHYNDIKYNDILSKNAFKSLDFKYSKNFISKKVANFINEINQI